MGHSPLDTVKPPFRKKRPPSGDREVVTQTLLNLNYPTYPQVDISVVWYTIHMNDPTRNLPLICEACNFGFSVANRFAIRVYCSESCRFSLANRKDKTKPVKKRAHPTKMERRVTEYRDLHTLSTDTI